MNNFTSAGRLVSSGGLAVCSSAEAREAGRVNVESGNLTRHAAPAAYGAV
jgi:hypothetical protein